MLSKPFKQYALGLSLAFVIAGCGSIAENGQIMGNGDTAPSTAATTTTDDTVLARAEEAGEAPETPDPVTAQAVQNGFVPDEVIVQFRAGADQAAARSRRGFQRAELVRGEDRGKGKGELERAKLPPGRSVADAVRELQRDPAVEFAEPNWVYSHSTTPTDAYYSAGYLWGLGAGYGSQAHSAWANGHTGSDTVYIGVIDEGIQTDHPDLAGVVANPLETRNKKDDDRNGYRDDVHGWDFVSNNNSVYDGTSDDHGTHVAGTIGARANNGGVVGVNHNVRLISAKFLGANGGTLANAVKAIDYLTDLKKRGVNIVATNNSWGGGGYSQALADAIARSRDANILFVAAAGNAGSNNDVTPNYPSNYNVDNVIAVAALTSTGEKASFSNYGAANVDLGAPGVNILSTVPGGYSYYSGTSMATPHVTGAAALYAASHPGSSYTILKSAILNAALLTPTASLNGITASGGRLNASGF